jgi:hypothetical protein
MVRSCRTGAKAMNDYDKICANIKKLNLRDQDWHTLCELSGVTHHVGSRHGSANSHCHWIRRKQARGEGFGRSAMTLHAMIALAADLV